MRKTLIALLCLTVLVFGSCTLLIVTGRNTPYYSAIRTYREYARNLPAYDDGEIPKSARRIYYSFCDIDGDGTKELLGGRKKYYGYSAFGFYSIQDGVAVQQTVQGFDASFLANGTIVGYGEHDDYSCYYYRFEDGELKLLMYDDYYGDYFRYDADGRESTITKEEYERLKAALEGDGERVKLKWKPLWAYSLLR